MSIIDIPNMFQEDYFSLVDIEHLTERLAALRHIALHP